MDNSLAPFFHPGGVVIVGASSDPGKLGYAIARNMLRSGYKGHLAFVNPKGGDLFGRPVYRTISQVPGRIDLAVMIVPAAATPAALEEVAQHGIRAAIISSGGFREVGSQGAELETRCLEIGLRYGMRLIGPNCIGLLDLHLPLDTTFGNQPPPPPGDLALISQSGAVCGMLIDWAIVAGFGFSRLLSLGNMLDVTETDMLPGVVEDESTRAVVLYIESLRDGQRFVHEASRLARLKPLVALKVGNSLAGQQAAASHTGALAGEAVVFRAAFEKAGILQAAGVEQAFDWAVALAVGKIPQGNRTAILTNAGGPGVIAADALESQGLGLAVLSQETRSSLAALLPAAASAGNPVDILGSADHVVYGKSLELLLADQGVDSLVVILPPPPVDTVENIAAALIPLILASQKPVVMALTGGKTLIQAAQMFQEAHIPAYRFPEQAVSALGALWRRSEFIGKPQQIIHEWGDVDEETARSIGKSGRPGSLLPADQAARLVASFGIPVALPELAHSDTEAVTIASCQGYPVVLKIASPDVSHKSDMGGVLLDIQDGEAVRNGFATLKERFRNSQPGGTMDGVLVQKMIPAGQEIILGARQDPQFGAVIMAGSGGVEVEGLKDVAFCLAPLSASEAAELLNKTWAGRKLLGYRNLPAADRAAVIEILQRLAQLARQFPEIKEMEINPLRVLAPGSGAVALDVRVILR